MTTYYVDQTVTGGTVLGNGGITQTTVPAVVDGDVVLFRRGVRFLDPSPGTLNAGTFDCNTKTVVVGCYTHPTGIEYTDQLDPYTEFYAGRGWPSEAAIYATYAVLDKGVNFDSPGNDTPLNNRSVIKGMGKNSIVRGLCVQGAWYAGMESTNVTNGDYIVDKCMVRNIGTNAAVLSGVTNWGVGIRHNFASAGKPRIRRTFIENIGEDGIWGAQTLGAQEPECWRVWCRRVGTSVSCTNHADNIQFQNPNNYYVGECILDHVLPETLDQNGASRVGNDFILAGSGSSNGGTMEDTLIITNSEGANLGVSIGGVMQRCMYIFLSNPVTVKKNGWDDGGIGFVNPGAAHYFDSNIFVMGPGRQNGSNGAMFGETDWVQGSVLTHNLFIGSGKGYKDFCFDTRTTTTGVARNNIFMRFANAIVNSTNPLATETNNAFIDVQIKRSTSKSGGTDLGVNATSFVAPNTALGPDYQPVPGSPLIAAGAVLTRGLDFRRRARWNPPTVGPFEYVRPRTAR